MNGQHTGTHKQQRLWQKQHHHHITQIFTFSMDRMQQKLYKYTERNEWQRERIVKKHKTFDRTKEMGSGGKKAEEERIVRQRMDFDAAQLNYREYIG